ncbi:hypothetical protein C9374_006575 [Naegleria lovaniensis]|uniref:Uncharacterized protein n=1 Tax=Naegleria lovaniensis TaxID=51637 RepID=A0AA88GIZ7_NAELO|nr:uncharacterized protein C9374_006575 [Naegleria lovaniensis]KAG2379458.1 hypothetical protein C9374_006575 [Naegleria lovaniensis]
MRSRVLPSASAAHKNNHQEQNSHLEESSSPMTLNLPFSVFTHNILHTSRNDLSSSDEDLENSPLLVSQQLETPSSDVFHSSNNDSSELSTTADGYVMVNSVENDDLNDDDHNFTGATTLNNIRRRRRRRVFSRMDEDSFNEHDQSVTGPHNNHLHNNTNDVDDFKLNRCFESTPDEDSDHRYRMTCMKEVILKQLYKNAQGSNRQDLTQELSQMESSREASPKKKDKQAADASLCAPAEHDQTSFEPLNTILSEEPFENNIRNTIAFTSMVGEGESESSEEFSMLEKISNSSSESPTTSPLLSSHHGHSSTLLDAHQASVGEDLLKHPLCETPKIISEELFLDHHRHASNGGPTAVTSSSSASNLPFESNGHLHGHHHHHGHIHGKSIHHVGMDVPTSTTGHTSSSTQHWSIEKVREQIRNELLSRLEANQTRYDHQNQTHVSRGYNIVLAGCSQSGKSQLKSLLFSVMNFENEHSIKAPLGNHAVENNSKLTADSDGECYSLPIFKNLDHTTRTRCLVQDSVPLRVRKSANAEQSNDTLTFPFMFSDMPGVKNENQLSTYIEMLSALYMGTYGEDDFVGSFEENESSQTIFSNMFFENRRSYNKIQREYHHLIVLTIPLMCTSLELKLIKHIQQSLDERSIPYLIVATKADMLDGSFMAPNHHHHHHHQTYSHTQALDLHKPITTTSVQQLIEMKKQEIAQALGMRSFDILTIGMSGASRSNSHLHHQPLNYEGLQDYESIHHELYHQSMVVLRQIILNCHRVRNNEIRMGWIEWFVFWLCMLVMSKVRSWTLLMQWCWNANRPLVCDHHHDASLVETTNKAQSPPSENVLNTSPATATVATQTLESSGPSLKCWEYVSNHPQDNSIKSCPTNSPSSTISKKNHDEEQVQQSGVPPTLHTSKTEPANLPTVPCGNEKDENSHPTVVPTSDEIDTPQERHQDVTKKRKFHRLEKRLFYNRIFQATVLTMLAILMFQTLMIFLVV